MNTIIHVEVSDLLGKTLVSIEGVERDEIIFTTSEGEIYVMYHSQDCCEEVRIDDVNGEMADLINSPLLLAKEISNDDFLDEYSKSESAAYEDSYTWTFYRFATVKGYVNIRWFGSSNGGYSESVDFIKKAI